MYNEFINKYNKVLKTIKQFENIVIFRHVRPDYDALGSQLALATWLKDNFSDKNIVYVGENHVHLCPKCFPYMEEVNDSFFEEDFLAIVLDTAKKNRISDERVFKAKRIIKIDHHPEVDRYGDINIVKEDNSACGELLADMLLYFKDYKISSTCAAYLYKAIVGDSNRFLNEEVDAHTFQIATSLVEIGLNLPKIYNEMYEDNLSSLNFIKWVLDNYKLSKKNVAYYILDKKDLEMLHLPCERAKECLYLFSNLEGVKIYLSISFDYLKNNYRVSLRSNGIDIEKVAMKYQGGGHKCASGARLNSLDEVDNLISDLDNLLP
ncbi:MAG: bifunctional oligoribonuclease/PAP phosphatase NrnA [Erysipelotrichaceae bacterium]|nr:bifunctional oligoribonuclease/PAP phosphatase NrnA [Erysipelotrichaceae bacterium]